MANPVGPLGAADERFDHQIPDTFATVGVSDPVLDREGVRHGGQPGRERAARVRHGQVHQPERPRRVRRRVEGGGADHRAGQPATVSLAGRDVGRAHLATRCSSPCSGCGFGSSPMSASPWPSTGSTRPPCLPPPRSGPISGHRSGYRVSADLVRYHQIGTASGWVEIDGERHQLDPDRWVSTRDHSWGVRYDVGHAAYRHGSLRSRLGHGLPDDLVPGPDVRSRRDQVGAVHAPGGSAGVRPQPPDGDRGGRAR